MATPGPDKVRLNSLISKEASWRLNLHAVIEGVTVSDVVERLAMDSLPDYKVSIQRSNGESQLLPSRADR